MITKAGRTPRILPYPMEDIERTSDGVLRYTKLVPSLVHLLRATVESGPDTEALVELGGDRLSYQQLWDRASRVAGGLRAIGINRGDRVASASQRNDWALAFFGIQMLGASRFR
jgi:acyl-CoA synthetase (AMP-forming)/AMP-acid ligase II